MTGREQLKKLVEEYCDPHIDEVEWVSARGRARWDYLSLRNTAIAGADWVSRFKMVLDGYEGDIDFQVPLPMETRYLRGPYGSGSWYWAESDADVFGMLRERGASFSFPKPIHAGDGMYANADLVAFFAYCPPGVAEWVLADHGVRLEDIDFSDSNTERVLKVSGNAHAFCWIRDNQPGAIDLSTFTLEELCSTRLVEPLLQDCEDDSIIEPEVVEAVLARVEEMVRAGKHARALAMVRKLRLNRSQVVHLVQMMGSANGPQTRELCVYLEERAQELESESEWERDAKPEGGLNAWRKRWLECISRLDVGQLESLVGEGVDVPSLVAAEDDARAMCTLVRDVACAYDDGLTRTAAQARAFMMAALDAKVRLKGNGTREVMQVFRMFPGDEELFARLTAAGFTFHVEDGPQGRGSGDTAVVRYLMSPFYGRVTAASNRARSFERKALDWQDTAYMLCHGAVLRFDCAFAEEVRREFRQHPWEFVSLAKEVPPQSMIPISQTIDLLSPLGEEIVLDVLCSWENLFDMNALMAAIDACAQRKMTEATAYLLELRETLFSGVDAFSSLEL